MSETAGDRIENALNVIGEYICQHKAGHEDAWEAVEKVRKIAAQLGNEKVVAKGFIASTASDAHGYFKMLCHDNPLNDFQLPVTLIARSVEEQADE